MVVVMVVVWRGRTAATAIATSFVGARRGHEATELLKKIKMAIAAKHEAEAAGAQAQAMPLGTEQPGAISGEAKG